MSKDKEKAKKIVEKMPEHIVSNLKVKVFTEMGELQLLSVYKKGNVLFIDVGDYV